MEYHIRKTTYADGSDVYAVCPSGIIGRKRPAPLPLDICPFDGKPIYNRLLSLEEEASRREKSRKDAVLRARRCVEALGRCNKWDYFFTLTFNPEKVNSFDYEACVDAMKLWIDNLRHKNPDMRYILVFEPHKSGRYHVHGLVSNVDWNLIYAKTRFGKGCKPVPVFNLSLDDYSFGFSTVSRVVSSGASARYIAKYIVKTLEYIPVGKKRYWASRNLSSLEDCTVRYLFSDLNNGFFERFMERLYDVSDLFSWVKCPGSNKAQCYFTILKGGFEKNEYKVGRIF